MTVKFHMKELGNGLRIVGEQDPNAHTSAVGFWISTGSRDEETELMGVSHFLEHMMFKGTERRTAEDVNREFDEIGAVNNAFTSAEMTAYWAHMLPENMSKSMDILSDILRPSLREEDFDSEKQVILEEIAMYEDQPFWVLYEHAMERFYGDHKLSHRVLGTRETVAGMELDRMKEYFNDRYSSDNTVVVAAGCFDFDQLVDQVESLCGDWVPSNPSRSYQSLDRKPDRSDLVLPNLGQAYQVMLSPAPDSRSEDRYAAALLSHTLGGDETSKLYWSLVETGICEEAQSSFDPRDQAGEFAIWSVCSRERLEEVESLIMEEVRNLPENLVQDDLDRARARTATHALVSSERPMGRLNRVASNWIRRQEYTTIEEDMAAIDDVTIDDIIELSKVYPMEPLVVAHASPE